MIMSFLRRPRYSEQILEGKKFTANKEAVAEMNARAIAAAKIEAKSNHTEAPLSTLLSDKLEHPKT